MSKLCIVFFHASGPYVLTFKYLSLSQDSDDKQLSGWERVNLFLLFLEDCCMLILAKAVKCEVRLNPSL
mgnify:CR=1 FL=1